MDEQERAAQQPGLSIPSSFKELIEALVFAAREPLSARQLKAICEAPTPEGTDRQVEQDEIERAIAELNEEYQRDRRPFRIIPIAGGYQFATLAEYAEWIGRLAREQARRKLSQSAVETLAIIAYRQPISRPEIESIRGVNCDYVLRSLLEKDLVTITGRADTVGRPLLYGTTREFLQHFGLNMVTDLPRPREIEEILGETQFETERRMLEAQAAAEQARQEVEDFKSRLPHIPKRKPDLDETAAIVPRKRREGITLKPREEEAAAETSSGDAGRRAEDEGSAVPAEMSDLPESTADASAVDAGGEGGEDQVVPEVPLGEEEEPVSVPPAELPNDNEEPLQRPASEVEEHKQSVDGTPVEVGTDSGPAAQDTGAEQKGIAGSGETRAPSRWQTWKHRVREIIRKLFG